MYVQPSRDTQGPSLPSSTVGDPHRRRRLRAIMAQTGYKSLPLVRKYIREGSLFRENAAAEVGL